MLTFLLILTIITQLLITLFVFVKNPKSLTNILFALLSLASLFWALSNFASIVLTDSDNLIHVVRFILFLVVIQNSLFYLFARTFPDTRWKYSIKWLISYLLFSALVAALTLTPYVFSKVQVNDGITSTAAGPAIVLFMVHASFSIIAAFVSLVKKEKRAAGRAHRQLQLLLIASVLNWILVPITNFALTPLLKTTVFIEFSPFYNLLFSALIAYTIISQKLFDIRFLVARAVAYFFLLGTVVLVYAFVIFGVTQFVFSGSPISESARNITFIVMAVVLTLTMQPFKTRIDKFSNKIFFQDAYDAQVVINRINSTLVNTLDLETLLTNTAKIIQTDLKVSYTDFYLEEKASIEFHLAGTNTKLFGRPEWARLMEYFDTTDNKVTVVTQEGIAKQYIEDMQTLEIEAVVMMTANDQDVGLLIVGPHKSGNAFTPQDVQLLEIIAAEVAIAVQNALRFEEISQFNVTLQQKIDDATHLLQKSNEKLKALDEAKDEFISMASHQLRTPLTSVKGYISMVLEGDAGEVNDQQKTFLDQAYLSSQRMVYLIADLLNVSRLKTGKFVVELKPTYLPDVVESEIAQLYETAKARELKLVFEKPESFPTLNLDETKTRQVIMNFADNAIYYTPKGGKITINLKQTDESIEFTVRDTGMGVSKSDQHHLFTKFYRAGNAKKARPDGTGLGLFMAKKVVVAQGGAIIFKTEEGKGSTFGFSFPRARVESEKYDTAGEADSKS